MPVYCTNKMNAFAGNILLILCTTLIKDIHGSMGDRMVTFRECVQTCLEHCIDPSEPSAVGMIKSPRYNWLIWECKSECNYKCMWNTVEEFEERNLRVPQFFGKWPFIRVFGVQEPASTLFSILNAVAHLYGLYKFRQLVPKTAPLYYIWHLYCMVALNTWLWSTLFHTRDFEFTEKMDYFCATSLVTYQLFGLFARLLVHKRREYLWVISSLILLLCVHHIYKMAFIHFDYGYHVKINVIIGVVNAIGWLVWGLSHQSGRTYVWKSYTSILLAGVFLSLEVLDFPPILWVFDAHSLWHAGTAVLTPLWYSFVTDDCIHMLKHEMGVRDKTKKSHSS